MAIVPAFAPHAVATEVLVSASKPAAQLISSFTANFIAEAI